MWGFFLTTENHDSDHPNNDWSYRINKILTK
jgi:hypothetical protein